MLLDRSYLTITVSVFENSTLFDLQEENIFLISNFRRVLNHVGILLGISPASDCCIPTFRNTLSVPSS